MNILYLKELQNNPSLEINNSGYFSEISGLSEQEIVQLEKVYNNFNTFPKALRELLFLGGKDCYVFDNGLEETPQQLQNYVRNKLIKKNKTISRPFYVIDIYNAPDQFIFVYLDEGDNPPVYEAHYEDTIDRSNWIVKVDSSLSNYINYLINRTKKGENPF